MKRLHLGIVATLIVLSGLGVYYVYQYEHGDATSAPAAADAAGATAESAAKEGDKKVDKPPVSRVAQTVQTWPNDKPPVSAPAETAAAAPAAEAAAPAGEGETATAPAAETSPAQTAAPAPMKETVSTGQESAPQQSDQRDAASAEGAAPEEHSSADTRTAQTSLLASGGEHSSKAPAAESSPPEASPSNESGNVAAEQPPSAPVEPATSDAGPTPAPQELSSRKDKPSKAPSAKPRPSQKEVGEKAARAGAKAASVADRPFDAATSWWPAVGHDSAKLSLVYAGEAAFDKAIVLLFSKNVAADAGSQIRLLDGKGKTVTGSWSLSPKNPQMLICEVPSGRYLVSIPAEFSDSAGDKLGSSLQGPVYVH